MFYIACEILATPSSRTCMLSRLVAELLLMCGWTGVHYIFQHPESMHVPTALLPPEPDFFERQAMSCFSSLAVNYQPSQRDHGDPLFTRARPECGTDIHPNYYDASKAGDSFLQGTSIPRL